MLVRNSLLAIAVTLAAFGSIRNADAQAAFTLTSPDFKDGGRLATKNAGNTKSNPNCVGENVSPALSWSNPPEGTKSYALMMFDPEGRPPGGVALRHGAAAQSSDYHRSRASFRFPQW